MSQNMPGKRIVPPGNPPQEKAVDDGYYHCKYCQWLTKSPGAYRTHISRYHEEDVVREGNKSLREGGGKWHGDYIRAYGVGQDWPTPTPEQWQRGEQSVAKLYQLLHPGERKGGTQ